MMGADGSLFAARRDGYPDLPEDLVDDMAASISVLFRGQRCVSLSDALAFEHSVSNSAEEFRRKRRIACGSYSTYRYLRPQLARMGGMDRFKFASHKLLRWWGGFFLVGGWLLLLAASLRLEFAPALLALSAGAIAVGAVGARAGVPVVGMLWEVLLGVCATSLGVVESVRGQRYATWEPASTR